MTDISTAPSAPADGTGPATGGGPDGNGPTAGFTSAAALVAVAVIAVLTSFSVVEWTGAQATLAGAAITTGFALVGAVVAHLLPRTRKEPVAIAAAFTAFATSVIELGNGFDWWAMTPDQETSLVALVAAVVGLGVAFAARSKATPI